MVPRGRLRTLLLLTFLVGLVLRLAVSFSQPTLVEYAGKGGDSGWYLANGAGFISGMEHGSFRGIPVYVSAIGVPPFYIVFVGIIQNLLPDHETIIAIRLIQCLASVATIFMAFQISTTVARDTHAGLITAVLMAFHPALIVEPSKIATETMYIFFITLGLWLYIQYVALAGRGQPSERLRPAFAPAFAGMAFALATLTRAVAVLFPFIFALHLASLGRSGRIQRASKKSLLTLLVYVALVSTWTIHNLALWNQVIIVSDQLMPTLWRAASSEDGSPQQNDALLLDGVEVTTSADCVVDCKFEHATENYINKIEAIVSANPSGYLALRINELAYAILQPHGTTPFGAVSVMQASQNWLVNDRSLDDLLQVLRIEGFAIKLATWVFHYIGIGFGLLGMLWTRNRWITAAPLAGFALYTIAVHFFLLALPRYLFPIEFVWLIFAGIALAELPERLRKRRSAGRGG